MNSNMLYSNTFVDKAIYLVTCQPFLTHFTLLHVDNFHCGLCKTDLSKQWVVCVAIIGNLPEVWVVATDRIQVAVVNNNSVSTSRKGLCSNIKFHTAPI